MIIHSEVVLFDITKSLILPRTTLSFFNSIDSLLQM